LAIILVFLYSATFVEAKQVMNATNFSAKDFIKKDINDLFNN
jgi:hypothetical protein